jgi:hypothetical protein
MAESNTLHAADDGSAAWARGEGYLLRSEAGDCSRRGRMHYHCGWRESAEQWTNRATVLRLEALRWLAVAEQRAAAEEWEKTHTPCPHTNEGG